MASAAPSSLASSVEKTNGAKLSRLLIDGGTTVLRSIFDRYHPPASLSAAFFANYLTLNNLLKRRVLHRPQWDLLFPPSGAPPDSQTFDITLLFLLLTNICGLVPPRSGWHTKPPPGDISVEANLARIKFYRNELYGHVSTTGIDTPKFSVLWQEISAVLVTLGLHQAEINRLKVEHCGEEDYIDALLEWADSEEDIKSQLRDIRHVHTKVQEIVGDVRQTQLEDHEVIQEGKAKLEEVHQLQTNLQQTVGDVCQSQLEGREILQESKGKLEDVYQIQLENHQTLQDSQTKLEEARRTQLGDSRVIQDTKSKVEEACKRLQNLEVESQQNIEDSKGEKERVRSDEILTKLAKIDTSSDIRHHANRYVEGTRLPIFADVERWLDDKSSPNRVMVISGSAGMGKSVISAVLCRKMMEAGRLSGSHFCQHNKARHRNPKVMLQSLACQLSDSLPEYKNALLKRLSRNLGVDINDMEVGELFEMLFEEPLQGLNDPDSIHLMVIDGLDESEYHGRNELLDVIADYFKTLPHWVRFVVTTRPELNISERLQDLDPMQLKPDDHENLKDIKLCFKEQLKHVVQLEYQETILEKLVEKSEGVMLYMCYLIDFIKENAPRMSPDKLVDSGLPSGISSVYQVYFKRLKTELEKEVGITEVQFFDFLNAIVAAREPLPVDFVYKLFLSAEWSSAGQQKVRDAIDCISALLPIEGECIHFFHKSVKDWLIDKSSSRQKKFTVGERQCHRILSKLCTEELDGVKFKGIHSAKFKDTTMYALQYGVQHILEVEENARPCSLEEVVKKYVLDLELVYAKLCVNSAAAAEDVLCVQEQKSINTLFGEYQRALGTLLFLLRKHISTLTELPHAIFQTLLNEGGSELSCEALSLLNTKYSDIPYMEYLQKKDPQAAVKMRFYGSDQVACFDVSPNLDYMVCECNDGTIHLWSLRTAKKLWKRAVEVSKIYQREYDVLDGEIVYYEAYRVEEGSHTWSLYRSVVFHPTLNLILPGILSHAYTVAGDLKPLFVTSKCRFQICSISEDKTTILTDCLENKRCIIQWSLKDGTAIARFTHKKEILTFAWSSDGTLIAISDSAHCISLVDAVNGFKTLVQTYTSVECGMLKITPDCQFLFGLHFYRDEDIVTDDFILVCLDIKRDSEETYYFDHFPIKTFHYTREFEYCNESGFLSGDPFWYPFGRRFNYDFSAEFALVLNKQFVLRASPCSHVIEMFSLDDIRERRGEFSDEAEQRAELGDVPEQRVELDNVAEQRAKINDLLVQGTEIGDLSEETVESDDVPEQGVELDDLPEQGAELHDLPEQGVELDDLPKQGVELDDLPKQGVELDDLSEQGVELDDLPEQGVELDDLPKQGVELDDLQEQGAELDDLPKQGVELDDLQEQVAELDDLQEQGVELDDLQEQVAELDDLPEQGAELDDLSEQGAELDDLSEQVAELDDLQEQVAELDDLSEQGAELDDLPKQGVELDDLSEQGAELDDLPEQGVELDDLPKQGVELDDLQEQGVELDDLQEQGVELDDLPKQGVELDDLSEQVAELDDLPKQGVELDDLSEQVAELDDLPEQRVELDDLQEQRVELHDLPEQGAELDDLTEQRVESDDLLVQGTELDDRAEQTVELDDLPEQRVELDDLTEQRAEHAYLEEQGAELGILPEQREELDDLPENRANVDYLPEQGDHLGDLSELSVELDDLQEQGDHLGDQPELSVELHNLPEQGAANFDDLLEAELDDSNELDDPDNLEYQGPLLEDLEEKSVDEVCDLTIKNTVDSVVFSINGDTLYVVMGTTVQRTNLTTWDISRKKYKDERNWGFLSNFSLLPVKRGVLFHRSSFSLELWNSELSECIQSWTDFYLYKVAPISEERVALETQNVSERKHEVVILDTTSGDIVSIIGPFDGRYLACNSKCEVLTWTNRNSLQLRRGDIVLWDNSLPLDLQSIITHVVFSPTDRFFVSSGFCFVSGSTLYVFDTVSGRALHMLCSMKYTSFFLPSCEFVSDDECVVSFHDKSRGACLRLYNAESGELLSEIVEDREVSCLAASPIKRLVAIGFKGSKNNFEIIQVKLPGDKERRNNKRFKLQE